uniref:Hypotheticial protein n=1 Tax=Schistosoma japonicum TaxID=6182 RepID=C1LED8_SCHJA|nr:hypotheticial protein [Schistosoma japonicum]
MNIKSWIINWLYSDFSVREQYTLYKGKSYTNLLTKVGELQGPKMIETSQILYMQLV